MVKKKKKEEELSEGVWFEPVRAFQGMSAMICGLRDMRLTPEPGLSTEISLKTASTNVGRLSKTNERSVMVRVLKKHTLSECKGWHNVRLQFAAEVCGFEQMA